MYASGGCDAVVSLLSGRSAVWTLWITRAGGKVVESPINHVEGRATSG
jgi:hypothetical protein